MGLGSQLMSIARAMDLVHDSYEFRRCWGLRCDSVLGNVQVASLSLAVLRGLNRINAVRFLQ